jgi:hypothetical protein
MAITLPREDSPKDKEKEVEKDFREKIGIMEQLIRSLYEMRELSVRNIIRRWLFRHNFVSFEIVAKEKVVSFYVVMLSIKQDGLQPWHMPVSIAVEGRHAIGGSPYTDYDLGIQREYYSNIWLKSLKFLQGLGYCQDSSGGLWAVVRDDLTMEIEA